MSPPGRSEGEDRRPAHEGTPVRTATARAGDPVPSPCNDICTMDPASGWCRGCKRSIDEIAAWSTLDEAAKRAVWDALPRRRLTQGPA